MVDREIQYDLYQRLGPAGVRGRRVKKCSLGQEDVAQSSYEKKRPNTMSMVSSYTERTQAFSRKVKRLEET